MPPRFAELLGRSCFSFLEGASRPAEMVEQSQAVGQAAFGLCDRDGLYGSVRAHVAAGRIDHPVVVGAELTLELTDGGERDYAERPCPSVALIVQTHQGYRALCRLLTASHADHDKGEAGITAAEIAADGDDLFAVVPLEARCPLPDSDLAILREAFGERIAIGLWRHLGPEDRLRRRLALQASERHDIPIVATNRPLYHHRRRKPLSDVLHCIRYGTTLEEAGTRLSPNAEASLKGPKAMAKLFADEPAWLERSAAIAEQSTFSLGELRYHFPNDYGEPGLSPDENLRRAVEIGIVDRFGEQCPADVRAQIEKELALIAELEVASYFLSVQQIVNLARERQILCQGRGSAANSAVCYVLGVTSVDPVRSNLLFERFMSSARREPPDIDVDFEHERREEVIQEIYRRYGRDRAAMVSEIICYRGKSALREVGKVFGLSGDQVDRLSSIASHWSAEPEVNERALKKRGLDPSDAGLMQAVTLAREMSGFPRHLSIHVGGFVLSSEPLDGVSPIEPARMADRTVIPWDKDDIDDLGFFKVDVLGLGMLTAIRKALGMIHERRHGSLDGFDPIAALGRIPPEDPAVYDACCAADTLGVFQIESRAQMAMLPILRPRCFYDLVVEVGIVRPGPIQGKMVHPYLRRRTGEEEVSYPHPCLEPILSRTLGVPLFQEQVMQLAITGAGYDPGEADQLRRDMAAWRKNGRLELHKDKLLRGFLERGISADFAKRLFMQIRGFGEYGFPECVVGDTLIIDADTGRRVPIEDIVNDRTEVRRTITCDARLRLKERRIAKAIASGEKHVYRLRTALGRELTATAEHPLLTIEGWRNLGDLAEGDHVAVARKLPKLGNKRWPKHQIVVLADLITGGNLCHPTTFYFYSSSKKHKDDYVRMVEQFPNTRTTVARHRSGFSVHVKRARRSEVCGALVWANQLGLRGVGARDKRLPSEVFELDDECIAQLLARMWEGDGTFSAARHASYDTSSVVLADQVQHLLLRLGIIARCYERTHAYRGKRVVSYTATVTGTSNLQRLNELFGPHLLSMSKRRMAEQLSTSRSPRMSRDIVPAGVRRVVREAKEARGETWKTIGETTEVCTRESTFNNPQKRGFRRWVIERLGNHLQSDELTKLGTSELYWDRIVSIEPLGKRPTYDLTIEGDGDAPAGEPEMQHNFLANDFVVHNSHSSSFALLVYASVWLKVYYPAAFAAALVNAQPMGFYTPGSIIRDAQKHGVEVRPIRVEISVWDCTLEGEGESERPSDGTGGPAIRLGLRLVRGFGEKAAERLVRARREQPFTGLDDVVKRAALDKKELEALAEAGAFEGLTPSRREALWRLRAPRENEGLFEGLDIEPDEPVGLPPMSAQEQLSLDYGTTGISLSDHPMKHLRKRLRKRRVKLADEQKTWRTGQQVTVAGVVLTRQRPGTASGVVFITLEDETGTVNLVLYSNVFERYELVARHSGMLLARGRIDRRGEVVHVRVSHLERLDMPKGQPLTVRSRDFH